MLPTIAYSNYRSYTTKDGMARLFYMYISRIHVRTFFAEVFGLKLENLEVSVYCVYIAIQFITTFAQDGGENS